jgi:hypothetical protein
MHACMGRMDEETNQGYLTTLTHHSSVHQFIHAIDAIDAIDRFVHPINQSINRINHSFIRSHNHIFNHQ